MELEISSLEYANGLPLEVVKFNVGALPYIMAFSPTDYREDPEGKCVDLGLEYKPNSFDVKFDLLDNFETGSFYIPPENSLTISQLLELGQKIINTLDFHHSERHSEAYYAVAENTRLKKFYDRLVSRSASKLQFYVISGLGDEGLGYEITTPSYKGKSR